MRGAILLLAGLVLGAPEPPAAAPDAKALALRLLSDDVRASWDAARAILQLPASESREVREALGSATAGAKLPVEIPDVLPAGARGPLLDRIRQAALLARLAAREVRVGDGMVAIPGGIGGRPITGEEVLVPDFLLDRTEVSRGEFARFLEAAPYRPEGEGFLAGWTEGRPPAGTEALPVTDVARTDAEAFSRWRGARLPTAEEWAIARGGCARTPYPWGTHATGGTANVHGKGPGRTEPVDGRPDGATPLGVLRLAGNVAEWTASPWGDVEGAGIAAGESFLTVPGFGGDLLRRTRLTARRRDLGFRCAQ